MTRGIRPTRTRSAKAGCPPETPRRQKTAHVALSKSTTLRETDRGPRAAWSGAKPMWKKR
ncbi:MAG: hypothetical protein HY216_11165 [Candidatus Rokubacteria bacterium]|nr:hypothetical protein [Candidatus Rokubacteria bacterium]